LHFAGLDREEVYAIFYDNSLCYSGAEVIHKGDINSVGFSFRRLCDAAVLHKASYLVLAHNHPHGLPIASGSDLNTTSNLRNFLSLMNVELIDHFIVGESRFTSVQRKEYDKILHDFMNDGDNELGDPDDFC
jgi:DNA repair protein RadC